ncbi:hypothetical protein K456DRAFT_32586 [Colletotrichum gloeosporioides 23]|nr:hypothetical protein K456DRAFT_32586 [Colletotrichum gloeosporioides 23]
MPMMQRARVEVITAETGKKREGEEKAQVGKEEGKRGPEEAGEWKEETAQARRTGKEPEAETSTLHWVRDGEPPALAPGGGTALCPPEVGPGARTPSVDSGTGRGNGAPGKEYLPGDGYPAKASGLCAWLFLGVSWLETWVRTVHSHVALDSLPEGSFNLGGAWVRGYSASGDSELRQDTDRGRGKGGSAPLGVSARSGALSVGCSSPRVVSPVRWVMYMPLPFV